MKFDRVGISLLQEGFRYNALHVCASKNQAGVAKLLLDTLNNAGFYQLLYPQDVPEVTDQRLKHMVDLYLNMPDKGVRNFFSLALISGQNDNEVFLHWLHLKIVFCRMVKLHSISHANLDSWTWCLPCFHSHPWRETSKANTEKLLDRLVWKSWQRQRTSKVQVQKSRNCCLTQSFEFLWCRLFVPDPKRMQRVSSKKSKTCLMVSMS